MYFLNSTMPISVPVAQPIKILRAKNKLSAKKEKRHIMTSKIDGSRTTATSKMEHFVIIVNG